MRPIDDERRIAEVRAARQGEAAQARRLAVNLFAAVRPFAQGTHNSGNLFEVSAAERILRSEPVAFNAFWGVGGKNVPDEHDEKLLGELARIRGVIASHYQPGADIQLMLADEHGRFNRFTGPQISRYLVRIEEAAANIGIGAVWLSDLYRDWGLKLPDPTEPIDPSSEFYRTFWTNPNYSRQRIQLVESASRHSQAGVDSELSAYHYARMRRMEAPHLSASFPNRILLANTSKELGGSLLPSEIPHLYLRAAPAWFLGVN